MKLIALFLLLISVPAFGQSTQPATTQATQPATTQAATQPATTQPTSREKMLHDALLKAEKESGYDVTYTKLVELGRGPGVFEKAQGFFTFTTVLIIIAAFVLVVSLVWLAKIYLIAVLLAIPAIGHEIMIYAAVLATLIFGFKLHADYQLFFVMPAALVLFAGLAYTRELHFVEKGDGRKTSIFPFVVALLWSVIAIVFQSQVIGFLAVLAFLTGVGFSAMMVPGVIAIGFEDEDAAARGTFASFVLLLIHIVSIFAWKAMPPVYIYFAPGFAFLGTFVYFLGLLIIGSKWYAKRNYLSMQFVMIVSGIAALYLGNVYGVSALSGVGGTFFCIYLVEKYIEIVSLADGLKARFAWASFGAALIIMGVAWVSRLHPEFFLWN